MKQKNPNHKAGCLIIVDDEAELMTVLCEKLAEHGYETVGFTSGAEALEALKEQDYDLLLTDLVMPGMDGIGLIQAGLEIDPNLVGIIMTGQGTVQTAVDAMKIGAFDYILKPFKLNLLLPLLSRAMEVHHLRMENIQLRETMAMHELGEAIAFSSDLNAILNKVVDAAIQQCSADEASIMLPTSDGMELVIAVARGGHTEHVGKRIPIDEGIAGWVAQNRKPVTLSGEVHDERFAPINPRSDIRAAVSIPMLAGGNLVGVLNVNITQRHRPFTRGETKALNMLVSIVAPLLENTWLYLQIREAEEQYHSIYDNARDGIALADAETGTLADCNQALCRMVEREKTELVGQAQSILHPPREEIDGQTPTFRKHREGDAGQALEDTLLSKGGALIAVEIRAAHITLKGRDYLLGIFRDITERKRAEENRRRMEMSLQSSHNRLKTVLDSIDALVYVSDMHTYETLFINQFGKDIWGEIEGQICWQTIQAGQTGPCPFCTNEKLVTSDGVPTGIHIWEHQNSVNNNWYKCLDQAISWIDGRLVRMELAYDITEQKLLEETVLRERSLTDRIMKTSPAGIIVVDSKGTFTFINPRAQDILGLTNEDISQGNKITDLTVTDFDGEPFLTDSRPFAQAMATGNPVYGVHLAIERADGQRAFLSVNGAPIFNDPGRISDVVLTIDDVTELKKGEERLKQSFARLQNALDGTVRAMAKTVEARDPYTAGHQERVAKLAYAIARELNLSPDQINGIQMAGIVHDIGKIYVPAEILSKPSKLSDLEFRMVKSHADVGYQILKTIDFPYPIADIVHQHHERMDGSGYPKNISGSEILLEARILAVSDVVEAMASHRPYRPSIGIDKAFEEISRNKGILYDPVVVDACLRLFRDKGFELTQ
jgi:PAS domain S-box-containing protein/putative nucleotidyltransferase with HDIG domain